MANDQTVAPVIIRRKKIIAADGHHGGAWKVAYADFVTAMMAFFMLMWLLNATTEQQKKGIADYFSPTLAINRSSGGGDSSFVGDTVFTEETLTRQGVGASTIYPTESAGSRGATGLDDDGTEDSQVFQEVIDRLSMQSGESAETDNIMKHIVTRVTDEGLVVEFYDSKQRTFFDHENKPTALLGALMTATFRAADMATLIPFQKTEQMQNGSVFSYQRLVEAAQVNGAAVLISESGDEISPKDVLALR
jgi:chemotaxis protein MotB